MIAQRFRALGWVAGIASAATGLYLVSVQVAAERAKLEQVDRSINAAHRDMQQLKTELSTRASYRQLEKWNAEDLSMAAPRADQYLHTEAQLASLSPDGSRPAADKDVPRAQLAAATVKAPEVLARPNEADAAGVPQLRHANYVTNGAAPQPKAQRVAMLDSAIGKRKVIDGDTLGDLFRAAETEGRSQP